MRVGKEFSSSIAFFLVVSQLNYHGFAWILPGSSLTSRRLDTLALGETTLAEVLSFHRRFTFGAWDDDSDVALALRLMQGALLEEDTTKSMTDPIQGMDSADPAFEELLGRLKQHAGFKQTTPWIWPSRTSTPASKSLEAFVRDLEDLVAPIAQQELKRYLKGVEDTSGISSVWDGADYTSIAPDWSMLHLWRGGRWVAESTSNADTVNAAKTFLGTSKALRGVLVAHNRWLNPMQQVACGIARQPAGTGIAPHCDGNLLGETVHIGLIVPSNDSVISRDISGREGEGFRTDCKRDVQAFATPTTRCWIEVGGERRYWEEGRALIMDTTFSHRTCNPFLVRANRDMPIKQGRGRKGRRIKKTGAINGNDRFILMLQLLRSDVAPSHVPPVVHYLTDGKTRGGIGELGEPRLRDVRILDPFDAALDEKVSKTVYPCRYLQRAPDDPTPATFRALSHEILEDINSGTSKLAAGVNDAPSRVFFRYSPHWRAPCVAAPSGWITGRIHRDESFVRSGDGDQRANKRYSNRWDSSPPVFLVTDATDKAEAAERSKILPEDLDHNMVNRPPLVALNSARDVLIQPCAFTLSDSEEESGQEGAVVDWLAVPAPLMDISSSDELDFHPEHVRNLLSGEAKKHLTAMNIPLRDTPLEILRAHRAVLECEPVLWWLPVVNELGEELLVMADI